MLASFVGALTVTAGVARLEEAGTPHYPFPEAIARTLGAMARYTAWISRPRTDYRVFDDVDRAAARAIIAAAEPDFLSDERAAGIGFPLAMKIRSPEIIHKWDVDGVRLNLKSRAELAAAYDAMMEAVRGRRPDATIEGVLIQSMAGRGREVILGLSRDPQFRPVLLFGFGGIYVEVLRDVTFRLAPIREFSARRMVEDTRSSAILHGVRGEPASDIEAIITCLLRLSQFAVDCPEVAELDINPLFVYSQGQGAAVADARIRLVPPGA